MTTLRSWRSPTLARRAASQWSALAVALAGVRARRRAARAAELLEALGMAHRARRRPAELSGGQQQRVAIARALASSPRVLVADEPTGQLDAHTGREVMTLLRSLVQAQGMTAVVATHDQEMVAVADRTVRLLDGRLVEEPPV